MAATASNFFIKISGTTRIITPPVLMSVEDDSRLWELAVDNDGQAALVYFKSGLSNEATENVVELLIKDATVRFYGTVQHDRVMVTEMYLNLHEPLLLAI